MSKTAMDTYKRDQQRIQELKTQIDKLLPYVSHKRSCAMQQLGEHGCTCGLREIMEQTA